MLKALVLLAAVLAAGCSPALPDPDSPGAVVLRERCAGCHRVYAPGSMTAEMWKIQVERMRVQYDHRGLPWLTPAEQRTLMDYLTAHAGTS